MPQVLELLERSFKTGGLELSEVAAETALAEIIAEAKTRKVEEPPAVAEPTPAQKPRIDAPTFEDEAEAASYQEGVLDSREAEKANLTDEKIKAAIDEIYAASGVFPADLDLQARLKSAIEGRLRYRSWQADDGQKRSVVEVEAQNVQFLPRGGEQSGAAPQSDDYAGIDVPPIEGGEDYPW